MDYEIIYKYRNKLASVTLTECENIMDAMFKFYEAHGMECEITKIDKY